jgi:predicted Zn-dependent protease
MDLHARGVAHLLGGDANTARRELKSAAEAEPRNATYWNDVAAADLAANDATAGLAAAETAMRRDPSLPQAQFNRAVALAALGRNAEAQSAFDSIVAHNPNSELAAEAARRRSRIPFHESTAK